MNIKKFIMFGMQLPLTEAQRKQAKRGMGKIDITKGTPIPASRKGTDTAVPSKDYLSAKQFIQKILNPTLGKIGIKPRPKYFSKDYPLNTLADADSDYLAQEAANVLKDESRVQKHADLFFKLFGKQYDQELAEHAAKKGKTPDALTEAEHEAFAHTFTKKIATTVFSELLMAQKVSEIEEITRKESAFEDFAGKRGAWNKWWGMHCRKYFHSRAKYGGMSNFDDFDDVEEYFHTSNEKRAVENDAIMRGWLKELEPQLSSEEKLILKLKCEGYTQTYIAKELGISQSAVCKKIHKLEKRFEDFH